MSKDIEDIRIYKVVVNDEEQYSIWLAQKPHPVGWHDAGKIGRKEECLQYIEQVWTDMRPLSLRRRMAENRQSPEKAPTISGSAL
jgi:MbtH protein